MGTDNPWYLHSYSFKWLKEFIFQAFQKSKPYKYFLTFLDILDKCDLRIWLFYFPFKLLMYSDLIFWTNIYLTYSYFLYNQCVVDQTNDHWPVLTVHIYSYFYVYRICVVTAVCWIFRTFSKIFDLELQSNRSICQRCKSVLNSNQYSVCHFQLIY